MIRILLVDDQKIVMDHRWLAGGGRIFRMVVAYEDLALKVERKLKMSTSLSRFSLRLPVTDQKLERGKGNPGGESGGCEDNDTGGTDEVFDPVHRWFL